MGAGEMRFRARQAIESHASCGRSSAALVRAVFAAWCSRKQDGDVLNGSS